MWLLLLFIAVPVIEIALFIQVGGLIGLLPTLAIVVLTAILGTYLVRAQGLATLSNLQNRFSHLQDPTEPLAHGAMILFAGALLLTPGFFTDLVGFLLLTPAFRMAAFKWAKTRIKVSGFTMGQMGGQQGFNHQDPKTDVYDGDYTDVTPTQNSPWNAKNISKD